MISKRYKIADKVAEIRSLYDDVHAYCIQYLTDESPDYTVTTSREDIAFERRQSAREHAGRRYTDGYLEELAVYRKIAEQMIAYDTLLLHGSAIAVDGAGYLFTAKSGTGKSTHAQLWKEYFGDRAVIVNDDKPLLRIGNNGVTVYGTPFNGKHRRGANLSVPLKAVCLLTRAEENTIVPITPGQAYPLLLQQLYRSPDRGNMAKTLALADSLARQVRFFRLGCNMTLSAARVAYEGMQ